MALATLASLGAAVVLVGTFLLQGNVGDTTPATVLESGAVATVWPSESPTPSMSADPAPSPTPDPESTPVAVPVAAEVKATKSNGAARLTTKFDGPWVAGESVRVTTRLANTGDKPIWWHASSGISLGASLPGQAWRQGEPVAPGVPSDLKGAVHWECEPLCDRIVLDFGVKRVNGDPVERWGSDMHVTEELAPGDTIVFVHEWDGLARYDRDTPPVGLPPTGPVDLDATAYFSTSPDGNSKEVTARAATEIVGGRDDTRLHPFEVVDAALEDSEFSRLMDRAVFPRDNPWVEYDIDDGLWYVGTCSVLDDDRMYWRLGAVDPVTGQVPATLNADAGKACKPDARPTVSVIEEGRAREDVSVADATSSSVELDPGPTPKPTPFRNEGTRVPWQEAPDRMYRAAQQRDYAGWYLDTDRDRLPVLMWAGDLDEAGALLIEVFGEDATFEVRPADRTWKELRDIANQVSAMRLEFDERGILLVETEFNVKRNRVDAGIKATKKKQAVAERMLAEFGDAVRVRRVNVPQFDS